MTEKALYESWGRYPKTCPKAVIPYRWIDQPFPDTPYKVLPYGKGRSYGDVCLNDGQALLDMSSLDHFLDFDQETGILKCEAGVTLDTILSIIVPKGYFLPVTPGTKFVTLGGAIANDVHGKNHHVSGTFGRHVLDFQLLRSDGKIYPCSPKTNKSLYHATIGGLGLTGIIVSATIQLIPISNAYITETKTRFGNLEQFFTLTDKYEKNHDYTVAWIDCLATGKDLGRGIFMAGNHAPQSINKASTPKETAVSLPFDAPGFALNHLALKSFNSIYYHLAPTREKTHTIHYSPFFYPLDSILHWNRLYGKRGFLQYQCVIPHKTALETISKILQTTTQANLGSFLAVLKRFGDLSSPGIMSFPMPGFTLALDFPNQGQKLMDTLLQIDELVIENGGRVYPAKDARLLGSHFKAMYPQYVEWEKQLDPAFSSSFYRRVMK